MGLNVTGHAPPRRLASPWDADRPRLDPNREHRMRHGLVSMAPMQKDGFSFIAWQLSDRNDDDPIGGIRMPPPQWSSLLARYGWPPPGAAESELTAGHVAQNDSERLFRGSCSLIGLVPGSATKEVIGCRHSGHGMAPAGFADV